MAATVKRTAQSALTLWGRTSSSNTQKVLWTLAELDLTYSLVHASARLGPNSELLGSTEVFGIVDTPEYTRMNPHQQIPTLSVEHSNGTTSVIWESNTIVRYLASKYGPQMHCQTLETMAQGSMWMDWSLHGSNFAPSFGSANHHMIDQVARTTPTARDIPLIRRAHSEYLECLGKIDEHLKLTGAAFVLGDELSIGDIPLAVELNRWALCVHRARSDGIDLKCSPMPHLAQYYCRMMQRKPFEQWVYTAELNHQALDDKEQYRSLPGDGSSASW